MLGVSVITDLGCTASLTELRWEARRWTSSSVWLQGFRAVSKSQRPRSCHRRFRTGVAQTVPMGNRSFPHAEPRRHGELTANRGDERLSGGSDKADVILGPPTRNRS